MFDAQDRTALATITTVALLAVLLLLLGSLAVGCAIRLVRLIGGV